MPLRKAYVSGWIFEQSGLSEGCSTACLTRLILASMAASTLEREGRGSDLTVLTDDSHS